MIHGGLVSFPLRPGLADLLKATEEAIGAEIEVRQGAMPPGQDDAPASGGFDFWKPVVTINAGQGARFDELSMAHETLHIHRFGVFGAPFIRVNQREITNPRTASELMLVFDDITNQLEHVAFFPRLETLGFEPHADADSWKLSQLTKGLNGTCKRGDISYSNLILKSGFHLLLGKDKSRTAEVLSLFERAGPGVTSKGERVAAEIRGNDLWRLDRLKIAYRKIFQIAEIPKRALALHYFDVRAKREWTVPFD